MHPIRIEPAHGPLMEAATALLNRFFVEEGFSTASDRIAENVRRMSADPWHWIAVALDRDRAVGVVTVSTALYVEWGRFGEIGDLYVLPEARGRGVAGALLGAAVEWSRDLGCSTVGVTVTPGAENAYDLRNFYEHLGFRFSGRTTGVREVG
jgi:GNAT superfamily N-acetyltransferase